MDHVSGRIGFDGSFLQHPNTGMGQYSSHLWRELTLRPSGIDPVLLSSEASDDERSFTIAAPSCLRQQKLTKLWWEQRGVSLAGLHAGVDAIHVPYFAGPLRGDVPVIITIHDVIPMLFPEYARAFSMRAYLSLVSRAARRAVAIITDSECSRRDIERLLGIPASRIEVIPLAVNDHYQPRPATNRRDELREAYGLTGPVIFNVGGLDVRKNVPSLIEAFARALPDIDPDTKLVIAGSAHTGNTKLYPPLEPLIRRNDLESRVVLTGPISEDDKIEFYNLADLYVFPSFYEGYGLSPLEAMACGTPVICSNRSSLPEVVGDGGLLVDPVPERLTAAIVTVMRDNALRDDLRIRGLEQASRFSWQRTAELTQNVYKRVINRHTS